MPGDNYKKWQVKFPDGSVKFFDPDKFQIVFNSARLVNRKSTAEKIYNGSVKTVCAWIEVEKILIFETLSHKFVIINEFMQEVKYNPKKCTNWTNDFFEDLDGQTFIGGYTDGTKVIMNTGCSLIG